MVRASRMAWLGLALVFCTGKAPAFAAEHLPAMVWDAPASCIPGELLTRVAGLTGLAPDRLANRLSRVSARVRQSKGGFTAQLTIHTPEGTGERSFEAEDCASLVEGTALILALTIDPTVADRPAHLAPFAGSGTVRQVRFLLGPAVLLTRAALPGTGLAYGVAGGATWPHLRLAVVLASQSAQTVARNELGRGGRFRVLLDSLAHGCVVGRAGRTEPAACLGLGMGWMKSTGQGIPEAESHDALSVEVVAGLGLGLRLYDWLWLRGEGLGGWTVRRPRFLINGDEEVYRVRPVTVRMAFAIELRL